MICERLKKPRIARSSRRHTSMASKSGAAGVRQVGVEALAVRGRGGPGAMEGSTGMHERDELVPVAGRGRPQ